MKTWVLLLIIGILGISMVGCQTRFGKKAGQAVEWVRGTMTAYETKPIEKVNMAISKAVGKMGLIHVSSSTDLVVGQFVYRNAKDEKITISTKAQGEKTTRISIQVGAMGDETQSNLILKRIREEL